MAEALPPDPLLGEIRLFAGNFAPKDWAFCDGRLLNPRDYPSLFRLLGNTYGGDGVNNFALPDLQCRVPVHAGPGFLMGQKEGVESFALLEVHLPKHMHTAASNTAGGNEVPSGNVWGTANTTVYADAPGDLALNNAALARFGNGQPHENRIPFLGIYYIISLNGRLPESAS